MSQETGAADTSASVEDIQNQAEGFRVLREFWASSPSKGPLVSRIEFLQGLLQGVQQGFQSLGCRGLGGWNNLGLGVY